MNRESVGRARAGEAVTVSWMNSGLVDAVAWVEGTRAGLREGGATQHRQARMRSCTIGKVQGVIQPPYPTPESRIAEVSSCGGCGVVRQQPPCEDMKQPRTESKSRKKDAAGESLGT